MEFTKIRQHRTTIAVLSAATVTLLLSSCASPENSGGGNASNSSAAGQQTASSTSGPTCTIDQYGGTKIDLKNATVGFSQSEAEANPFRTAETQSIKDEASKLGIKLIDTNANSDLGKQVTDIKGMIAQGVQALIVAPLNSTGLDPALQAARAKNIPVITIDRKLSAPATACKDYVTFIGSDFLKQGERAAQQLVKATNGQGKVAVLLGASGNDVTNDRTKGFTDYLTSNAKGLQIVAQQTADFTREKGQSVTEQLLQAHPEITAIYAENDEMALGAVTAVQGAGKKPGTDIKIVSIDGTKNVVQDIVNGTINGDIETNPHFGPLAFSTLQDFEAGKPVSQSIVIEDKEYDSSNAKTEVNNAY